MSMQEKLDLTMTLSAQKLENTIKIKQMLEEQQKERAKEAVPFVQMHDLFECIVKTVDGNIGSKIEAIKLIRSMTGCPLKKAKDLMEKFF